MLTAPTLSLTAKGDIRRLARRGGVTCISGTIYSEVREVMKDRVRQVC